MIEPGDFIFTKQVVLDPNKGGTKLGMKGHAICILIGNLQPKQKPPTLQECEQLAAGCGLTTFDEVGEILGKDAMDTMIAKLSEKYGVKK